MHDEGNVSIMKDWLALTKQNVKSGLWALIALDMYYKDRAEGRSDGPVPFLRRVACELSPIATDQAQFQHILLAAGVQLLGDDFGAIAQVAADSVSSSGKPLSAQELTAIVESYQIYGQAELIRSVLSSQDGNAARRKDKEQAMPDRESTAKKTVEVIDLVGYSDIIRSVEENLDSRAVAELNDQIQNFIKLSLDAIGTLGDDCLMKTTGDGAILQFDRPEEAHLVAERVHRAGAEHNRARTEFLAKRYFRIGIATGEITRQILPGGRVDFAGLTISNAVRLESQCRPGEVIADAPSFALLPRSLQLLYGPEERVKGKRDEVLFAHRCRVIEDIDASSRPMKPPSDTKPSTDRRLILSRLQQLGADAIDELIFLMNMPVHERPSASATPQQRYNHLLQWAERQEKLADLDSELRFLSSK